MNNYILFILVLAGISIQNVAKKAYGLKNTGGDIIFSAASVLLSLTVFLITSQGKLNFTAEIIGYAIGFAVSYGAATVFSLLAIKTGSLSLTSLFMQYSLIIPTFYGIFVLGEQPTPTLIAGLVLLFISIILVNLKKGDKGGKVSTKWIVCLVILFAGNGICSTVQKVQQLNFEGQYKNEFMIISLVVVTLSLFAIGLFAEKGTVKNTLKNGFLWYTLSGLANGIVNYIMMLLAKVDASIVFPVISAGGIVVTALISIFIYKEKLSGRQNAGMILGIFSIILLTI